MGKLPLGKQQLFIFKLTTALQVTKYQNCSAASKHHKTQQFIPHHAKQWLRPIRKANSGNSYTTPDPDKTPKQNELLTQTSHPKSGHKA